MLKTERQPEGSVEAEVESAENITQEITHEAVPAEGVSQKSLM